MKLEKQKDVVVETDEEEKKGVGLLLLHLLPFFLSRE